MLSILSVGSIPAHIVTMNNHRCRDAAGAYPENCMCCVQSMKDLTCRKRVCLQADDSPAGWQQFARFARQQRQQVPVVRAAAPLSSVSPPQPSAPMYTCARLRCRPLPPASVRSCRQLLKEWVLRGQELGSLGQSFGWGGSRCQGVQKMLKSAGCWVGGARLSVCSSGPVASLSCVQKRSQCAHIVFLCSEAI